ncbi:signal transduction histidine kinase [Rhodococcus sp. 27YEA15]|uniref:sensor histidine kinase n=1 Tax=Rhodococcus sp. 27YEA15 TaxID=3156259 RepID=UPI003C7D93E2
MSRDRTRVTLDHGVDPTASSDNLLRLFARFICVGYLCYLILLAPTVRAAAALCAAWWTPFAVGTVLAAALALGVASFLRDVAWVTRAAALNAMAFILVNALWWAAWDGTSANEVKLWITTFPGLSSLAAAAAWTPTITALHLVVAVSLSQFASHAARTEPTTHMLFADISFSLMFCSVFVAAAVMAMRTGRVLDSTIASTYASTSSAAAAEATAVERERFGALVHDTVMSTLLAASRNERDPSVIEQAQRTVSYLDDLRSGTHRRRRVDIHDALAQLRSVAAEVDESIIFITDIRTVTDTDAYPSDSIHALSGALAEALRNSVRHAGPHAVRRVGATVFAGYVEIIVSDDGVGFDPSAVSTHRLGITVSIHARMQKTDGGSARVRSTPGQGTVVELVLATTPSETDPACP